MFGDMLCFIFINRHEFNDLVSFVLSSSQIEILISFHDAMTVSETDAEVDTDWKEFLLRHLMRSRATVYMAK